MIGAVQDITERKLAEEASRRNQEHLRALLDATTDVAFLMSLEGAFLTVNKATADSMGRTAENLVGVNGLELLENRLRAERAKQFALVERTGMPVRFEDVGIVSWSDNSIYPVFSASGSVEAFAVYSRDISEQKSAEEARLALAVERERNETLRSLVAGLSHDIKSPLTIINTSAYLLEKHPDSAVRQEKIESIRRQTQRLNEYLEDLLTAFRLDGEPQLSQRRVDLAELLSSVKKDLDPLIEQNRITFSLLLGEAPLTITVDPSLMRRALTNLIQNALNYTPEAGSVTVRAEAKPDSVVIEVADSGTGIAAADLPRIFEPFFRGGQAQAVRPGGSGLGLAIVQRAIRQHSGHVQVESELGKGTTFRVVLPTAKASTSRN